MERPNFVNSTNAIAGSSSPTRPSSSEFEISTENNDEDEHDARRSKPEEVTVHLATSFLHHALFVCLLRCAGAVYGGLTGGRTRRVLEHG